MIALVALIVAVAQVNALDIDFIRCKVCERAIEHVWDKGALLRKQCAEEPESDPRCDFSAMHSFGIEEMVHGVCDGLPKTHAQMDHSEFDLVPHDTPQHTAEAAAAISKACNLWLKEEHGAEHIALYIYANLDAHKA